MPAIAQQPYVIARLVDESGSIGETRVTVRESTGRDAGIAAAQLLADRLDSASSCTAVEFALRYPVKIVLPAAPVAGSNVRGVGVLIFSTTDPEQFAVVELPGIKADLVDPDDPTILLLDAPAIDAYINALIAGVFCNPFGYQLVECVAGLYELRQ